MLAGAKVIGKLREESLVVESISKEPHSIRWQIGVGHLQETPVPLYVNFPQWSGLPHNVAAAFQL